MSDNSSPLHKTPAFEQDPDFLSRTLSKRVKPIGGHLSCFFPGMLALGARGRDDANAAHDLKFAAGMMDTCWQFYDESVSGLGGEYLTASGSQVRITDPNNKLRPEVAESLMIMWRVSPPAPPLSCYLSVSLGVSLGVSRCFAVSRSLSLSPPAVSGRG